MKHQSHAITKPTTPQPMQNTIQHKGSVTVTDFSSYLFEISCGEVAAFNCHISQHPLLIGLFEDIFLHCPFTDQPKEVNMPQSTCKLLH